MNTRERKTADMSIEAMAWALNRPIGGTEKVVLLGLANHAHHDGSEAYPSVPTLAKYACCSERTVQRMLRKLVAQGWLMEDGSGPRGEGKYRLDLARKHPVDGGRQIDGGDDLPPDNERPEGVPPAVTRTVHRTVLIEDDAEPADHEVTPDEQVYAYWVQMCKPARPTSTPSRMRSIAKALKETGGDVAFLCRAIDGLVAWQSQRGGDLQLGRVFETGPRSRPLGEQIEWFASQAPDQQVEGAPAIPIGTPDRDVAILRTHLQRLLGAWATPDDPDRRVAADAAQEALQAKGYRVVRESNGRPRIVLDQEKSA